MAVNDRYTASQEGLANGSSLTITAAGTDTGVVQITELGGTGDADVYREVDEGQTGTFNVSVLIDQPTTQWHTQLNDLWIGDDGTEDVVQVRIENTSGGAQDYYAVGWESGTE